MINTARKYKDESVANLIKKHSNKAHTVATIKNWCDKLKHSIFIKRNFDTACWVFHNSTHMIYIGDQIFSMALPKADRGLLIEKLVYHEMSHALWTERDMVSIDKCLKSSKVPFKLFNLMEDARIEALWSQINGCPFLWDSLLKIGDVSKPVELFYALIHFEGDAPNCMLDESVQKSVYDFYERCTTCSNSYDVIDICRDWINEFGEDELPNDSSSGLPLDTGDLGHALIVSSDGSTSHLDQDSEVIVGEPAGQNNGCKNDINSIAVFAQQAGVGQINHDVEGNEPSDNSLMLNSSVTWDTGLSMKLAHMIKKLFRVNHMYEGSVRPSKRMNNRSLLGIQGIPEYARKSVKGFNRKKINLFIDCSGSMRGQAIENARTIIGLFNYLTVINVVECSVILSSSFTLSSPHFSLPVKNETIGKIAQCSGSEGLEKCFRSNLSSMKEASVNFVITDGDLADDEIQKNWYMSQGIYTVGLYCNSAHKGSDLQRWFNVGITRERIEDLVSEMLFCIRR